MLDCIRTISHGLRTRLFAAILLLPLVALATATDGFGLRCRMTGLVVSACCCDGGDGAAQAEAVATISQGNCCDRVERELTATPAEVSPAPRGLPNQTTPVATLAFDRLADRIVSSAFSSCAQARTSIGPPTVRLRLVAKSTFLI